MEFVTVELEEGLSYSPPPLVALLKVKTLFDIVEVE
jgi:hypothetical protein